MVTTQTWGGRSRSLARRAFFAATVIAAGAGAWVLGGGKGVGASGVAIGYAEAIHYSVAPVDLGRMDSLLVAVGQPVKAGEPLVTMDGRQLRAQREQEQAQLLELESEVVASMQDEEFQVTRSELWVLKARADERGDRAELAQITERMNRLDGLLKNQMIPAAAAEAAREKQRELEARIETFDQAKGRGQAGLDQSGAGNHDHAKAVSVHVEPARLQVEVQKANLRVLDLQIEQLTLRAPTDGVVTTISHRPGDIVPAGTEIVSVVGSRPGVLQAQLPEGMASRVFVGQKVTVRNKEIFGHKRHGHVIEVAPEVDELFPRARPSPAIPFFGRRAAVQLDEGGDLLPGQAFSVSLD